MNEPIKPEGPRPMSDFEKRVWPVLGGIFILIIIAIFRVAKATQQDVQTLILIAVLIFTIDTNVEMRILKKKRSVEDKNTTPVSE